MNKLFEVLKNNKGVILKGVLIVAGAVGATMLGVNLFADKFDDEDAANAVIEAEFEVQESDS